MISGLKIANPETRPPLSRNTRSTFYSAELNKLLSRDAIGFGNFEFASGRGSAVQSVWELHNPVQHKVRSSRDQWWGSVEDRGRGRVIIILWLLWDTMRHRRVKRNLICVSHLNILQENAMAMQCNGMITEGRGNLAGTFDLALPITRIIPQ